jgi:hypothetical protein
MDEMTTYSSRGLPVGRILEVLIAVIDPAMLSNEFERLICDSEHPPNCIEDRGLMLATTMSAS